ncbi:MAG: lysophospholipid acyltransferase family protein [Myxococcota bacterium]
MFGWTLDWVVQKLLGLWASSWRIQYVGLSEFINAANHEGLAVGLWHEDFCIVAFSMKNHANRFAPLVSKSKDGDRAEYWLKELGYDCIRGSSSRGGQDAFIELQKRLKQKESVAITIDGPRGPRRIAKPGLFRLHNTVECGLWMIRADAKGPRLPTWDQQFIPWPFSTVQITFHQCGLELTSLKTLQDWLDHLE